MRTRQILLDFGRCFRAATPPLLALAALTLTGTPRPDDPAMTTLEDLTVLAWWAAIVATAGWFLIAVIWAAARPLRDRRAFNRLQHLREIGAAPDRALVHVLTMVWSSAAGQHVVVVHVATGTSSRVWLPETSLVIGAFVVLERTDGGVKAVEWMSAQQVDAGHRHERRYAVTRDQAGVDLLEQWDRQGAMQLILETEQFLKEQETR